MIFLTHLDEFSKVHYYLTLEKVGIGAEKAQLLGVIDSLKKELSLYKSQTINQKSIMNPMLDVSICRSHAQTNQYGTDQIFTEPQPPLFPPHLEPIKKIDNKYAFTSNEQQAQYRQANNLPLISLQMHESAMEMQQQKVKLLESKILEIEERYAAEMLKVKDEHAKEMRVVLRHTEDLENRTAELEEELAEWKSIAEQRRATGGKEKEKELQRELELLKRKLNECASNEKLLRNQLREARETVDYERKKYGVSKKTPSREKGRLGSPWKKPVSRSGKKFFIKFLKIEALEDQIKRL